MILDELIPKFADDDWEAYVQYLKDQKFPTSIKLALYLKQAWGHLATENEDADWLESSKDILKFLGVK